MPFNKLLFFILCTLQFAACTNTSKHKEKHPHTYKLQKDLGVHFVDAQNISYKVSATYSQANVKIIAVAPDKTKTEILSQEVLKSGEVTLPEIENLEQYKYLVAIIKAVDSNGSTSSNVETYKVNEQDQINAAKKSLNQ